MIPTPASARSRSFASPVFRVLLVSGALGLVAVMPTSARTYIVDTNSSAADDANAGTPERPLKTINAAAQLAAPGDTVLVRPGTYRERVTPLRGGEEGKPIIYRADLLTPRDRVEVKGSDVCADWRPHPEFAGIMTTGLAALLPTGAGATQQNPYLTGVSIGANDEHPVARPASSATAATPAIPSIDAATPVASATGSDDPDTLPKTLGQLFFDGAPLTQATTLAALRAHPGSWLASPDGRQLWAHFPSPPHAPVRAPADLRNHLVEVTVRDRIFSPWRRGLSYIHVIGFTFGHCANQGAFPQGGAVSPRSGSHWLISGNTIRFARTIGLDVGSETWDTARLANTHPDDKRRMEGGHHIIENNIISDNGLAGIAGWHHNGVVIRDNILERNNAHDFNTGIDARWEEWGAIKLHGQGALIEGNLIRDNEAFGIWLDNDVSGSRITRNVVLNSRMAGIFIELNEGPVLIDTNIVFGTRPRGNLYDGMGIYTHDASDVTIAHNLVIENAGGGVVMRTISDRAFGGQPVESSRARILNNIVWNNSKPAIWLPFKNKRATGNVSDYNLLNAHTDLFQGYRPGQQLFGINVFKNSHTADEATAGLRDKLAAAGIPADQWPNLAWWRWQPYLSLDHWRLFTGQDRHSREPWRAVQMQVRPQEATLTALMDAPVRTMNCPRVEGVDTDFYGTPLASGKTLPGPFQNLAETRRDYILFPVLPRHTR